MALYPPAFTYRHNMGWGMSGFLGLLLNGKFLPGQHFGRFFGAFRL
jgi:hypothetical protein